MMALSYWKIFIGGSRKTAKHRWLLLSIIVMFAFATPGERLPAPLGDVGLTYDGLRLAAEHFLRLVLLLATLALLHDRLGSEGMITGLHWLLAPLAGSRRLRERMVVRLMLVLDYVERQPRGGWRTWLAGDVAGPESLALTTCRTRVLDWMVLATTLGVMAWWLWR
jgi:energy-coupling factor transport system permease protein